MFIIEVTRRGSNKLSRYTVGHWHNAALLLWAMQTNPYVVTVTLSRR